MNYWIQVDNVTIDGLLNTLSLSRALKAALSESLLPLTASSPRALLSLPLSYTHTDEWMERCACALFLPWCLFTQSFFLPPFFFLCIGNALQLLPWGGLKLIHKHVHRPSEYSTNPLLASKQSAHALENACGVINSISGRKTRLHPSHVVHEKNSWKHADRSPINAPLLLKTCDRKCAVDPHILAYWVLSRFFVLAWLGSVVSTGNAPWPQSSELMRILKRLQVWGLKEATMPYT